MSGASSEGPDSPDPKPAAALERVEVVQVHEPAIDKLGLVRLDTGGRLDKRSGEVTPTGGAGRVHLDSVTMVA